MKRRGELVKEQKEQARELTLDEVRGKERDLSDQLFRLKFQHASGQTDTLQKIRELRRAIARVKTILRERSAEPAPAPKA